MVARLAVPRLALAVRGLALPVRGLAVAVLGRRAGLALAGLAARRVALRVLAVARAVSGLLLGLPVGGGVLSVAAVGGGVRRGVLRSLVAARCFVARCSVARRRDDVGVVRCGGLDDVGVVGSVVGRSSIRVLGAVQRCVVRSRGNGGVLGTLVVLPVGRGVGHVGRAPFKLLQSVAPTWAVLLTGLRAAYGDPMRVLWTLPGCPPQRPVGWDDRRRSAVTTGWREAHASGRTLVARRRGSHAPRP